MKPLIPYMVRLLEIISAKGGDGKVLVVDFNVLQCRAKTWEGVLLNGIKRFNDGHITGLKF